ncbi:MAG: hypothetical protein ACI4QE_04615, partial [Acutalibacteraceae bacterium]
MSYSESADEILQIWVKDFAGNITKRTARLMIDKEEPIINSVTVNQNDKWNNEEVTIVVDATDIYEGIAAHSDISAYSFDGGINWQEENTHLYNTKTENIIIAVKDNAGNISYYTENKSGKLYTTDIDKATQIDIKPFDTKAPLTPDIYEENGLVYISSHSFDFDKATESPEHIEYKLGENGEWTDYDELLEVVRTCDVTIFARVCDDAGNESPIASFTLESTIGKYTASYTDIALGEGLFPVPFGRTYSSNDGWFFTFEANVKPFINGYVFTDFYGEKQYFIQNGEGKYLSSDEDELTVNRNEDEEITSYVLPYGDMTCTFDSNGRLANIKTDYLDTQYTWDNNGTLTITGGATVTFTNGNPTNITITRDGESKSVGYSWPDGILTKFTDAADIEHNYTYANGLLTTNDTETISYSDGRVKMISQPNGSFVNYLYNDTAENAKIPNNIGAVTVRDSKGITDVWRYSEGVYISSAVDSYSENAEYSSDINKIKEILEDTTQNSISSVAYVVEEESASTPGSNEPVDNEPGTDGDTQTDNEAEDVINGEENDA